MSVSYIVQIETEESSIEPADARALCSLPPGIAMMKATKARK